MKIAVNTRTLRQNQMDGIGWFAYNSLKHIVRKNPGVEFHFLFDSGIKKEFLFGDNVTGHNLFPPAKHALLNLIWFEWSVKRKLQQIRPDIFLSPDGILSLGWKGLQYGVIHDVNYVHRPLDLKWSNRKYYNTFFPRYAARAARIGTVSEFSKQDIVSSFGIAPGKIDVLYNGINSFYRPVDEATRLATRAQYAAGKDYFVFVSTLHPRKNIIRLLEAFDIFRDQAGQDMKLLLVGKEMYRTGEMHAYHGKMKYKDDVVFTGRLGDQEINAVVGSALAMVYVPVFEGFGIPPIEAMQCDVPVIASNNTSLPEVIGEAGILVDPFQVHEIARAMEQVATTPALRESLIGKGRVQRTKFSWERTADLLWDSLMRVS